MTEVIQHVCKYHTHIISGVCILTNKCCCFVSIMTSAPFYPKLPHLYIPHLISPSHSSDGGLDPNLGGRLRHAASLEYVQLGAPTEFAQQIDAHAKPHNSECEGDGTTNKGMTSQVLLLFKYLFMNMIITGCIGSLLLEKEMATHSTVLAWKIPGTGEPGGLPSMGLHRVGHD